MEIKYVKILSKRKVFNIKKFIMKLIKKKIINSKNAIYSIDFIFAAHLTIIPSKQKVSSSKSADAIIL